jgi:hypothetical protein
MSCETMEMFSSDELEYIGTSGGSFTVLFFTERHGFSKGKRKMALRTQRNCH